MHLLSAFCVQRATHSNTAGLGWWRRQKKEKEKKPGLRSRLSTTGLLHEPNSSKEPAGWSEGFLRSGQVIPLVFQNREPFPGGSVVKNLPASAADMDSIPGPAKPRSHHSWFCARESGSCPYWAHAPATEAHAPRAHALQPERPQLCEARPPQRESSRCSLRLAKSLRGSEDSARPDK